MKGLISVSGDFHFGIPPTATLSCQIVRDNSWPHFGCLFNIALPKITWLGSTSRGAVSPGMAPGATGRQATGAP